MVSGRFMDCMNRRPSARNWLRTAQRWYSSVECAAPGIWMASRRWRIVAAKSSVACQLPPARLRTTRSTSIALCRISLRSGQMGIW